VAPLSPSRQPFPCGPGLAQNSPPASVDAPGIKVGDSWTFAAKDRQQRESIDQHPDGHGRRDGLIHRFQNADSGKSRS
jgi:hypothetical protein